MMEKQIPVGRPGCFSFKEYHLLFVGDTVQNRLWRYIFRVTLNSKTLPIIMILEYFHVKGMGVNVEWKTGLKN